MNYQIEFINRNEKDVILIVEPWSEEFFLPQNKLVTLEVSSPHLGTPRLELNNEYLIYYIWENSTVAVYIDGVCVSEGKMQIPVPPT
jgi:hypothetical protein